MINMMKADLYRIFRGIGIYIAVALIMIISSVSIVAKEPGYIGNGNVSYNDEVVVSTMQETSSEKGTLVQGILAANINLYYPLIIIVFVILMKEFSNKTMKNTLSSAVSKRKYFAYKMIMSLGFSALFIIFGNLFAYVLNFIVNGKEYTEPIIDILKITILQMPMLLGIVSLLVFIGFLFKKTAIYNAISISFIMLFQIVLGFICVFTESENLKKFLENYELQSALNKLAYFPESKYCLICFGIGAVEILVFSVFGYYIFKKSEIK